EALQQALDRSLQRGNARFESADILSNGNGRLLPQLRWERGCGVHGSQSYAGWLPASKLHVRKPRERLPNILTATHLERKYGQSGTLQNVILSPQLFDKLIDHWVSGMADICRHLDAGDLSATIMASDVLRVGKGLCRLVNRESPE